MFGLRCDGKSLQAYKYPKDKGALNVGHLLNFTVFQVGEIFTFPGARVLNLFY